MHRSRRAPAIWLALVLSAIVALAGVAAPALGAATDDPDTAAEWGAAWLAEHVSDEGWVGGSDARTSGSVTIYTGLALAAADVERAAFQRLVGWVEDHYEDFVPDSSGLDRPGALGQVALLAEAAGRSATDFGGSDLVARIQNGRTPLGPDAGMYGSLNTSAAVFLHSFAMLGLAAAGADVPDDAIAWLQQQRCPDGAWPPYRSGTHRNDGTCGDRVPGMPEADASAMALQALAAVERLPSDAAEALRPFQTDDGAFAFTAGGDEPNGNSTGLALQTIAAMGDDPDGSAWRRPGGTAMSGLLALQLDCAADAADRGGFRYLPRQSRANLLATAQAVWGAALAPFPVHGPPADIDAVVCDRSTRPAPEPSDDPDESDDDDADDGGADDDAGSDDDADDTAADRPSRTVQRLAGTNRYASAVAVSRELFVGGVPVAYLATGVGFADALAAGPAAAAQSGPVLLTDPRALPAVVAEELARLRPARIVALGGPAVIADEVLEQAAAHGPVERIAGADRYQTAASLSRAVFSPGVTRVLVATGADFPDALAGIGAAPDGPLLLVGRDELPAATAEELRRLSPAEILVLGGTGAVSDAVAHQLAEIVSADVRRISGADRYRTAALLLQEGVTEARVLYVATGERFPDALAAAAAAGLRRTGVLLVGHDHVPEVVLEEIRRLDPARVLVLGGTASVSERVAAELAAA